MLVELQIDFVDVVEIDATTKFMYEMRYVHFNLLLNHITFFVFQFWRCGLLDIFHSVNVEELYLF